MRPTVTPADSKTTGASEPDGAIHSDSRKPNESNRWILRYRASSDPVVPTATIVLYGRGSSSDFSTTPATTVTPEA